MLEPTQTLKGMAAQTTHLMKNQLDGSIIQEQTKLNLNSELHATSSIIVWIKLSTEK